MKHAETPVLEAHRGVGTDAPENTLSAFRLAALQGYQMIELDPKFTRDNQCVMLHDHTVNRTARYADGSMLDGERPIETLTLAEARQWDYGIWFDPVYRGEPIPTLERWKRYLRLRATQKCR